MPRPWDRLSARDQVRLQESLLRSLVRDYLYPFSPFYRRLFDEQGIKPKSIRRLQDLEALPIVQRTDFEPTSADAWRPFRAMLRPDEESLSRWAHRDVLRRVARERLFHGDVAAERLLAEEFKPVHLHVPDDVGPVVGYTMRDLSGLSQAGARSMAVMGAGRTDVLVSALPYGPNLPFWHTHYAAQGSGMAAMHLGAGETVRPAQTAYWMAQTGTTVLVANPAYAEGLLRGAEPAAFARLRVLALWATGGMQGARERFTTRLRTSGAPDATVSTLFGIPEARVAWAECPTPPGNPEASNGYHTYPDLEYLEVVDPATGQLVDEGQPGELIYTSLDWRGSVLLRYRTGLLLRRGLVYDPCPGCGRTVPRILPDVSFLDWHARVVGSRGEVRVDLADVLPVLWAAPAVPLWQVEVLRGGGPGGTDLAYAYLGGALREDAEFLQKQLAPYGVRVRLVPLKELGRRMGLGTERPEQRVVIRPAER